MRKIAIGLLSIFAGLSLFAACHIQPPDVGTYTDSFGVTFTYAMYDGTNTCAIKKADVAHALEVTVPMEIEGYTVTHIDERAFQGCHDITSVVLPDSVTNIGFDAFDECYQLTNLTLGKNFKGISPNKAFEDCGNLTNIYYSGDIAGWCDVYGLEELMKNNVTLYINGKILEGELVIPDGVKNIQSHAFAYCKNLTGVTLPDTVTSLSDNAFAYCSGLKNVTLSQKLTTVENSVFAGCGNLESIVLPDGVTDIESHAFYQCDNLKDIVLPDSLKTIQRNAFEGCSDLENLHLPVGVTLIGEHAFDGCASLKSLTVPHSVTKIGRNAFSNCSGLTSIVVDKNNNVYHSDGNCLIVTEQKSLFVGCKNSVIPTTEA